MSQPYRYTYHKEQTSEPIECNPDLITKAQLNYIEVLKKKLNLSGPSLNALILSALPKNPFTNDIYLLSKQEGIAVIETLLKLSKERDL